MKILMFAHSGSHNRGCEAIVRSSVELIKERLNNAEVYLASENPKSDVSITELNGIYDASPQHVKKYSYAWLIASLKYKLFKDETYALGHIHKNVIKHIKNMDVFLSIGGDNYCYGEQPGWYEIDRRVKINNKKLVLWGCSIGEEDMSDRKLADLQLFDLILARETMTYEMLRDRGLTNVELCADPAFTMGMEELPLPSKWQNGNTIGLNFSPLVWERNKQSFETVKALIEHVLQSTDATIALTPHVIQEGNNDYEVLKQLYDIYESTNRVILLPNHLNALQYKGYISRMRLFIGARTHATIAAYSTYVPTLVLGYSVKSKGIALDLFGEEKLVLNLEDISHRETLINRFDELVAEEDELRQKLKQSIPRMKLMSYKAVEHLANLVQTREVEYEKKCIVRHT